jgi:hypothetical protein
MGPAGADFLQVVAQRLHALGHALGSVLFDVFDHAALLASVRARTARDLCLQYRRSLRLVAEQRADVFTIDNASQRPGIV